MVLSSFLSGPSFFSTNGQQENDSKVPVDQLNPHSHESSCDQKTIYQFCSLGFIQGFIQHITLHTILCAQAIQLGQLTKMSAFSLSRENINSSVHITHEKVVKRWIHIATCSGERRWGNCGRSRQTQQGRTQGLTPEKKNFLKPSIVGQAPNFVSFAR